MPGIRRLALVAAVLLFLAAHSPAVETPPGWIAGVGASALEDPMAAADEAASKAKAELGSSPAKLVIVTAAQPQLTPALIDGVKKHFSAEIIYGSQVTSPLTPYSNHPDAATIDVAAGVSVFALAGDTDIATAVARTDVEDDDVYYNAGVALAEDLKDAIEASERPGRLVVTFGDQYTGSNQDFATGLNDGFGKIWPIIGGASGNVTAKVIYQGEIRTGINVAILLAGDFAIGQSVGEGSHTPAIADQALAESIGQGDKEPFFAFIFNCRRRRTGMMERDQLAEELSVIKQRMGDAPFFGFYGPGEVGAFKPGEAARGMGFTVVTAVLFAQ
ncbi:MAG: FIST C-terminal domain-containing protein [Planctomycetaceae bacterium]|nr:FIST C-terminal domain-containing protein [Planctomycetaceae bacterium]